MKAILLAAGYGKRLGNYTKNTPKCLIKIGKKPIIEIWIDKLFSVGVKEVLINTHYLNKAVENHIQKLNYPGLIIKLSYEEKLLGTAGTVFSNSSFIDENCFLIHVDNFNNENLNNLIDAHINRPKVCCITMMVHHVDHCKNFGMVTLNKENILIRFDEKPIISNSNLANSAIYILSPDFVKNTIMIRNKSDFSNDVIPYLLGKIFCYVSHKENIDIGLKENLAKAKKRYLEFHKS